MQTLFKVIATFFYYDISSPVTVSEAFSLVQFDFDSSGKFPVTSCGLLCFAPSSRARTVILYFYLSIYSSRLCVVYNEKLCFVYIFVQ